MGKSYKSLGMNLGSTSTKVAIYQDETKICEEGIDVPRESLAGIKSDVFEQYDLRRNAIEDYVASKGLTISDFDFICCRGVAGGDQKAGCYLIDEAFVAMSVEESKGNAHPSYIGPSIAYDLAKDNGIKAYVYDSEGINEYNAFSRMSGHAEWPTVPGCHMLSAKAACRKAAGELGGKYEDYNFVVCHLGGGTTTSVHEHGKTVDATGDAFSPERAGCVPMLAIPNFLSVCFSGKYTQFEMGREIIGRGGLVSYIGTSDLIEVEKRIADGDEEAALYYDGMVYQLARDVAMMASAVDFEVDYIIFTGGMAHSKKLVAQLTKKVEKLAPVMVFPGSLEMESLACGTLRAVRGEECIHHYGVD